MAVQTIRHTLNMSANTNRGPSPVIWAKCPVTEITESAFQGQHFFDDFNVIGNASMSGGALAGSLGQWSIYGYQGSAVNDGQLEGGVIKIGSDGDNEGTAFLSSAGSFRFITTSTLALNGKMWFEARWARSTVANDQADVFVGLMAPTLSSGLPAAAQPITVTDDTLMTAGDLFGFHSNTLSATRGGPTEIAAAFVLASGTINYPTNCTTMMASTGQTVLAADTYVKTGFIFDPNGPYKTVVSATARQTAGTVRRALIRFFINGVELPTFLTSEDVQNSTSGQAFPTAFLCPCFAVMNSAAASNTLNVDWIRVAQIANS